MLAKITFFTAITAATLAVILLSLVSPSSNRKPQKNQPKPWLALSLYIQQPHLPSRHPLAAAAAVHAKSALVFHHKLTEGPENASRVVGKAQGFIIPIERFAHSAFNVIYLTLETAEYSGGLSIEARQLVQHRVREELKVVGGTGSFAFARGVAVFTQMDQQPGDADAMYHLKLQLRFSDRYQTIPG